MAIIPSEMNKFTVSGAHPLSISRGEVCVTPGSGFSRIAVNIDISYISVVESKITFLLDKVFYFCVVRYIVYNI